MLDAKLIFMDVEAPDKDALFHFLAGQLLALGQITNEKAFLAALYEREAVGSTYMMSGIAIPHGKSDCVVGPFVGFARLKTPIVWNNYEMEGEEGAESAEVVFVIGVPTQNTDNIHLKMIASICRRLCNDDLVQALKQETSAVKIAAMFSNNSLY